MILPWSFGDTELMIQVPTMLSAQIHAWIAVGEFTSGEEIVMEPSIKPSLFFPIKDFLTDLAQVK